MRDLYDRANAQILAGKQGTLWQMVRFGLVGVANTGITLGLILLLGDVLGVPYVAANAVGYVAGFLNSFLMNRIWTFRSKGDWRQEGVLFLGVFGVSYLVQLGALLILREGLGLGVNPAQVLAMVVYTGVNFALNKIVTFRSV